MYLKWEIIKIIKLDYYFFMVSWVLIIFQGCSLLYSPVQNCMPGNFRISCGFCSLSCFPEARRFRSTLEYNNRLLEILIFISTDVLEYNHRLN